MVYIIPYENKYFESLLRLENICFKIPWSREMFEEEFKSNITHYLVAVDGDCVVGYAGLWKVLDEGQITNIAIMPEYRRQGVAFNMLSELINKTKVLGIKSYTLEVRESNLPAQKLYAKLGFTEVGLRKNYYADNNEAAILMTMEIKQ